MDMLTTYILIGGFITIIGVLDFRTRRLQKQQEFLKSQIKSIDECLDSMLSCIKEQNNVNGKNIDSLSKINNLSLANIDFIKKIIFSITLLKKCAPEAVANTVTKVLTSPNVLNPREVSLTLLNNIKIEFQGVIDSLLDQQELSMDIKEKEATDKKVSEYENIICLISTVTDESSDEYIEQMFEEVDSHIKKMRSSCY